MKFKAKSPADKAKHRVTKWQERFKWHLHFCWLPVRYNDITIVWLETVARKKATSDGKTLRLGNFSYYKSSYDYGPVSNLLTQPGVHVFGGENISAAQASGPTVQGGPAFILGEGLQEIQRLKQAYDSRPPPGRLNKATKKPGL